MENMTRSLTMLFLALLPLFALAQTTPVDSLWGFQTLTNVKHSVAATLLRRNAIGGIEAVPGQRVSMGELRFLQSSLTVTFPGQKNAPMTITGIRLYHSATGTGWTMPEHPINLVGTLVTVPAGKRLRCTYRMPIAQMGSLECSVE